MKKYEYFLLLFVIACLIYYHNRPTIVPLPIVKPKVVVTPIVTPDIDPDDKQYGCDASLQKASLENKKLLIIFSATWCGHCRSLKKDLPDMDFTAYEICHIDIDDEQTKDLVKHFDVKIVPMSVIVEPKLNKEIKRISGYIPDKYKKWLKE